MTCYPNAEWEKFNLETGAKPGAGPVLTSRPAAGANSDEIYVLDAVDGSFRLLKEQHEPDAGHAYSASGGVCGARFSSPWDIHVTLEKCPPECSVTVVMYYLDGSLRWTVASPWFPNGDMNKEFGLQVKTLNSTDQAADLNTGLLYSQSLYIYQTWAGQKPAKAGNAVVRLSMRPSDT